MKFSIYYQKYNWEKIFEKKFCYITQKNGASITLEPGGQLELSGAPFKFI